MEAINYVGRAKKIIMALNEPVSYWTDKRREESTVTRLTGALLQTRRRGEVGQVGRVRIPCDAGQ